MLKVRETNVKEDCIEDVIEVFDSLGMKAELSQSKSNNEYYEQLVTAAGNEEDIESKIEFKPSCDEENYLSDADENEAKDLSLKGSCHGQLNFHMLESSFCQVQKHILYPNPRFPCP